MKKTGRLLPETGRSQATNLETEKQTKWIEMHQSQVNDVFPKRSAEMKTQNSFEVCKTRSGIQRIMAISRDFCGYSKLMFLFFVLVSFYASWKFLLWLGSSAWDFLGDNFWSSDFLGFVWSSVDFFGFWFLPHSIRSTPSGLELSWKGRCIFHTFHPRLIYTFLIGTRPC